MDKYATGPVRGESAFLDLCNVQTEVMFLVSQLVALESKHITLVITTVMLNSNSKKLTFNFGPFFFFLGLCLAKSCSDLLESQRDETT